MIKLANQNKILIRLDRKPWKKMLTGDYFKDYTMFIQESTLPTKTENSMIKNKEAVLAPTIFNHIQPTLIEGELFMVIASVNLISVKQ